MNASGSGPNLSRLRMLLPRGLAATGVPGALVWVSVYA